MKKLNVLKMLLIAGVTVALSPIVVASHDAIVVPKSDYAIVVSASTQAQPQWQQVVQALVSKHDGQVLTYATSVTEILPALKKQFPRYTCFVAPHADIDPDFVAQIHRLTRTLDADPYTDTWWGIVTGYDAANALEIAAWEEPLKIKKVAAGTAFATQMVTEGLWYDELEKNKLVKKLPGETAKQLAGPDDTTRALVEVLEDYQPDLFITSGHATERDWQLGFAYENGYFRSKQGQMFGLDSSGQKIEIESKNPKVYLPIGNCLMGNMTGPDSMALAWMNDVGVKQMLGYTRPTWYGYMGWGVLDYFVEQPGRYTLTEAFFANNHALVHRLADQRLSAADKRGLEFDRDVVAFYGDPKWPAKMAPSENYYDQQLSVEGDIFTLTIKPLRGVDSFSAVNTNGSQRGGRPMVQFLPYRIVDVELMAGQDLTPVVTDDFVLVPHPGECDPDREYVVRFRATPVDVRRQ